VGKGNREHSAERNGDILNFPARCGTIPSSIASRMIDASPNLQ